LALQKSKQISSILSLIKKEREQIYLFAEEERNIRENNKNIGKKSNKKTEIMN